MSDDSKELSRVEDILSGEDYLPKKPMSRVEELLMDGAMVPKVDDTDNGKVLKVIDGEWQPGEDVSGDNLPPVSSLDNGKVLKVISGEWNIGDDKSESSFVYISSSYPFSGSKVALPANINSVLIANYTSSPKVPTFLVTSNNIIFEPKEVDISVGTTPSVHIRWGRMYSTFDSATREQDIYNDSLSYNTQNQTTEASYFKTKAIQTIPPVDTPDNGKVMQVAGGHWVANILPEVDGVPQVTSSDIGKVLKATDENTYGWEDAPDPLPAVTSSDNGKVLKVISGEWDKGNIPTGLEVVKLSQTAYDSLSDAQKKNGKMYLIDASIFTGGIPRVSSYNSKITASSNNGSENQYNAWLAFDGIDHVSGLDYDGWVPSSGEQWIKYHFDSATPINKIMFKAISRNTTSWTGTIYIEGSNDDTNWENILKDRISIDTTLPDRDNSSVIFNEIANGKSYTYVRLRIGNQYTSSFELCEFDADITTLTYDSIYYMDRQYSTMYEPVPVVTMADAGKALIVNSDGVWDKGDIYVECTQAEYDLLPASKNSDGIIYFING